MKNLLLTTGILACMLVFGTTMVHAQTETVEEEAYEDFNAGQRFGTWALNNFVVPGLGSYVIMKDNVGGTVQLAAWGVSGIFLVSGITNFLDAESIGYKSGDDVDENTNAEYEKTYSTAITCFVISGVLSLGNFVFNIVRSASYHKPQAKTASFIDPNAWSIAILPGRNDIEKVQLSYTMRF